MEDQNKDYHISFFKPTTEHAKSNRNMVIWFVVVWAIAIFGFQLALYVLQEKTPEPSLGIFNDSWAEVQADNASDDQLQGHSFAVLSVLGKVFIEPEERNVLDRTLSRAVYLLCDSAQKVDVFNKIKSFEAIIASIDEAQAMIDAINEDEGLSSKQKDNNKKPYNEIIDKAWKESDVAKIELADMVTPIVGLKKNDVRTTILPLELTSSVDPLTDEEISSIEKTMDLYLNHYQSVLTDTKFLGFPFHYFYTSIFLLILFVGLCWLYCVRTDKINEKLNIVE